MYIFAIWDNRAQKFYESASSGKFLWPTKQAALAGVMFQLRCVNKHNYLKHFAQDEVTKSWLKAKDEHYLTFPEQTRYECRRYCLVESDYEIV